MWSSLSFYSSWRMLRAISRLIYFLNLKKEATVGYKHNYFMVTVFYFSFNFHPNQQWGCLSSLGEEYGLSVSQDRMFSKQNQMYPQ